ncbi:MAG: histone deacetylase family protein [Pseudomonadota bacterium]
MTTRLYTHDAFEQHRTPTGHPERSQRLVALREALAHDDFDPLERLEAPVGDLAPFARVHPAEFVDEIESACMQVKEAGEEDPDSMGAIDADTVISPGSGQAMHHLIGALTDAVDAVFSKDANNAFIAARPPGHHAEKTTAMGFCLLNGVAAAARYAQDRHGAERVAVVDWDVHHGNGTQDIFWDDASVQFLSTHQMPLFPGSGALREEGGDGAQGLTVNAPLSPGDGTDRFREAFESRILPQLRAFAPDMILISAGFDAHHQDPLGGLKVAEADFDWATGKLMDIADANCEGRIVSLLEGGYHLEGLAQSASAHIRRLMTA